MKIGIDIDDTIADLTGEIDIYAKEYTENILKRKFKLNLNGIYEMMWAKHVYGWSVEEDKNFWDLYYEKIVENVKPKDGAIETINKLYKNNEIIIITSRWDRKSGIINKITEEWLKKYNCNYNKLYINSKDKISIAKELKIDLFIDDSIKVCRELENNGIKVFIMNSRINENFDVGKIVRVKNWYEIFTKLENLK